MHSLEDSHDWLSQIAAAADLCMKPWKHSVVNKDFAAEDDSLIEDLDELILKIECRNSDAERHPDNDLEVEIYRSGNDLNLMISWANYHDKPILWHGQHSVWMDGSTGKRCQPPQDGSSLESLGRRIRALFSLSEQN